MIFGVECDADGRTDALTDRTEHTMIVSFIVLDICMYVSNIDKVRCSM